MLVSREWVLSLFFFFSGVSTRSTVGLDAGAVASVREGVGEGCGL